MEKNHKIKVVFVCLGNICRSPMAEAVFRHLVNEAGLEERFEIESAGTGSWHIGERPHSGTRAILQESGVELSSAKRAQQIRENDLDRYDYVIAMDSENAAALERMGRKPDLLLEFSSSPAPKDVPDPYYTNRFQEVYDLVKDGARGLLTHIRREQGL
jgi:protein-tyrosine phosphatase